jgi:multidrug efflux system membrane fusion protein
LVADRAILTDQNLKYVLTVNRKKNEVDRVDISVSERLEEDGRREVLKGLTGDEWIIVDGINRVRPGVTVAPKEEPMPRLVK